MMNVNGSERFPTKHDIDVRGVGHAFKAGDERPLASHLLNRRPKHQTHSRVRLPEPLHDWQTLQETRRGTEVLPAAGKTLAAQAISARMAGRKFGDMRGREYAQSPLPSTLGARNHAIL